MAFPFAVASMVLAGGLISVPVRAQSTGMKATELRPAEQGEGQAKSPSERPNERDDVAQRMEWFYRPRRYPLPLIPGGARQQALQQREASRRELIRRGMLANGASSNPPVSFNPWTPIGPTPTAASGSQFLDHTVNPTNFSGRINAIAVDPVNNNIVYLGGADGGLWKSTDAGAHWTALTDGQPSLAIGAIAIDPNSCGSGACLTIYVGTGEANFSGDSYYGAGVLKSTDGGMTFTQLGATAGSVTLKQPYTPAPNTPVPNSFVGPFDVALGGTFFSDIVVNPANSQKLLAAVRIFENADKGESSGIFCSDDAGMTWLQVVAGAPGTALVISPDGSTAYGALGNPDGNATNGVYKSSNATAACSGQSWSLTGSSAPFGTSAGRISLGLAPSSPTTLYAAIGNPAKGSDDLLGVYKTTNGGTNWSNTNAPNNCTPQCWYDLTIKVHPNNVNVVFLGGSAVTSGANDIYLLRSEDGGNTWQGNASANDIAFDGVNEIHVDQHAIAFSPPTPNAANYTMYVGNDGGAWSTPIGASGTATVTWTDLNSTLTLSQFYPGISIHPASQLVAIGGLQDNGSQKYDAGTNPATPNVWNQILFADGGYTTIDASTPSTVYATTEFITGSSGTSPFFFLGKSVTNGDLDSTGRISFSLATNGINLNDSAEFIPPLVGDPTAGNNRVMYFGTCQVYQSRDGAANWVPMPASSVCSLAAGEDYTTIAAAADGNTVYAGDNVGHVHSTTSALSGGGAGWSDVSAAPLPAATSVTDPTDGRAITKIAVALNNPQFALVAYSGFCGFQNIYSGVLDNVGHLFETTNGGQTWTDISGGCNGTPGASLPNAPVNDIVIDPADPTNQTIYAATDVGVFITSNGGGVWMSLDQQPRTLPDGAVLSLTLRNESRTLRAGLHGRGVWDYQLPLTPAQQTYSLASITPVFAAQGSGSAVTLTVNGQGFVSGDMVQFNGVGLATSFVSATQLTATIPAALLANEGTAPITVVDEANGVSNALPFSVVVLSNAAAAPPPNDAFANAMVIPATITSFTNIQNTANATANTGGVMDPPPSCVSGAVSNGVANSIWYSYTPAVNTMVEADTVGSGPALDTILLVVTGSAGNFTQVACNNNISPAQSGVSEVNFSATAGTTYYFMVSEFHGVGGVSVLNVNTTPTPTLTSINPASGQTATSFPVSITGSDLTAPLTLNFNGAGGSFSNVQLVSGSEITATLTIQSGAPTGMDSVFVTYGSGNAQSNSIPFQVQEGPPTLSSAMPSAGAVGGIETVTLTGTNFDATSAIVFGGTGITASSLTVVNSTTITATFTIAGTAMTQTVMVTTAAGMSGTVQFTVDAPPTLSMISPGMDNEGAAPTVTLTGTNFVSPATINVSGTGVTVSNVMVTSATTITATFTIASNASLGARTVSVTTGGATTTSVPAVTFTVIPPAPTLGGISPAGGTVGSSSTYTFTGSNFVSGGTTIFIPVGLNIAASNVNVTSSTMLTVTLAIGANVTPGQVSLGVQTAGGTSAPFVFEVGSDFTIAANPNSATVPRGTPATSTLTLTPTIMGAPFPTPVTFTVSGLPTETTCTINGSPCATYTLVPSSGVNMATLVITTTAPSLVGPRTEPGNRGPLHLQPWALVGCKALLSLLLALLLVRGQRASFLSAGSDRPPQMGQYALAIFLVMALAGMAAACGGGGSSGPPPNPGSQPTGLNTITVMATSGNVSHPATYMLTLQ